MKILYITTVGETFCFFKSIIGELVAMGNTVDVCANTDISKIDGYYSSIDCKTYTISCTRSPLSLNTIKAINEIRKIVENNNYDIVHCHTPVASICTRIACKGLRKKGLKVFYTAHGFHFYKGAPLLNWLIYYPIEKICSYWTDTLITINVEDYNLAKRKMHSNRIEYIPGVGIDINKINDSTLIDEEKKTKRKELNILEKEKIIISVGELSKRKNHEIIIRALSKLKTKEYKYLIAGEGELKQYLQDIIKKLNLENNVCLLGQRDDVLELLNISDLFIFPSFQEGLPVALMEAIACKVPIVCSNIRGNKELVTKNSLFNPNDENEIKNKINYYLTNKIDDEVSLNYETLKNFDSLKVNAKMIKIYEDNII